MKKSFRTVSCVSEDIFVSRVMQDIHGDLKTMADIMAEEGLQGTFLLSP